MGQSATKGQIKHRPTLLILCVLFLMLLVAFGWYYAIHSAKLFLSSSNVTSENSTTTSSAGSDSVASRINITGTITSIKDGILTLSEGDSKWSVSLKDSSAVHKLTIAKDHTAATESVNQGALAKNQYVTINADPNSPTNPLIAISVDILIQE